MMTLSTTNPGPSDVAAAPAQDGLLLACANAAGGDPVAFGSGLELALTRAADQAAAAPEWIQIFPAGPEIVARDGRRWTLPDPAVLVTALAANGADLPVDLEHAAEIKAPKGEPAPAQGWVKEIAVRGDGTTWARVDWLDEGAAQVTSRRYRYVSPAFRHTKDGQITRVTSLALVTQPALHIPALARDGGRDLSQPQDTPHMKTLAERLAAALGLREGATDDAIVQAATEQVSLASATRDPTKYVPAADLAAAQTRALAAEQKLADQDKAALDGAATAAVEAAIAEGKIAPVSKDHWVSLARENPEAFAAAVASMPAVLTPTDKGKKVDETPDASGLTADQKALCRSMGLDEVAYAATLKEISR